MIVNNLPILPSDIINDSALLKGYWIQMAADRERVAFASPTTPGLVDSICGLGAILRAFGLPSASTELKDAVDDMTECGEFMTALAKKVNPEFQEHLSAAPSNNDRQAYVVKISIVNWSDHGDTSKEETIAALKEVEEELGYRA